MEWREISVCVCVYLGGPFFSDCGLMVLTMTMKELSAISLALVYVCVSLFLLKIYKKLNLAHFSVYIENKILTT